MPPFSRERRSPSLRPKRGTTLAVECFCNYALLSQAYLRVKLQHPIPAVLSSPHPIPPRDHGSACRFLRRRFLFCFLCSVLFIQSFNMQRLVCPLCPASPSSVVVSSKALLCDQPSAAFIFCTPVGACILLRKIWSKSKCTCFNTRFL